MSLLLEALKKAALEKRSRGDAGPGVPSVEQQDPLGSEPGEEEGPAVSKVAAEYLAHQKPRPQAEPEPEPESPPEFATPPEFAEDIEPEAESSSFEELGFPSETEPETFQDPVPEPAPEPELAGATGATDVLADLAYSEQVIEEEPAPAAENLDLDLNQEIIDEELSPEDLEDALDLQADREALARSQSDARKAALGQLLEQSEQVAKQGRRRGAILYTLLTLTASGAIGIYYYYLSSSELSSQAAIVAGELVVTLAQDVAGSEDIAAGESEAAAPEPLPEDVEGILVPDESQPVAVEELEQAAPEETIAGVMSAAELVTPEFLAAAKPAAPAAAQTSPSAPNTRLLMERRSVPKPASGAIKAGYEAYQRGDLDAAELAYADALRLAPRQRDALLGAAGVAVQKGQFQQALRLYQRRLADNPSDEYAQAGLLALAGQGPTDPELRSEVKLLLADHPREAHLHFLLGSMQAAAGDWRTAQQAFFDARAWDKDNADYAYNLAVALEHINQPGQASRQYREALELSRLGGANFDTEVARKRLQQLESSSP